jgi:hypothetical protein
MPRALPFAVSQISIWALPSPQLYKPAEHQIRDRIFLSPPRLSNNRGLDDTRGAMQTAAADLNPAASFSFMRFNRL